MKTERLIKKTLKVGNQSKTVAIKWGAILQKNCLTSPPPEKESSVHYSPKTLDAGLPELTLVCRNHHQIACRNIQRTENVCYQESAILLYSLAGLQSELRTSASTVQPHTHAVPRLRCKLDHFRLLVLQ